LFHAPQCCGRAVSDAEPFGVYWWDRIPITHVAVACLACRLAFFPLRELDQSVDAVGQR
jgi:hypothetical protein